MQFFMLFLVAAGAAALDQIAKYLTLRFIPLYGHVPLVPGVVGLTQLHNTGAAFSSFEGMRWIFVLIFLVFTGALLWEYFKKPMPFARFERVCIAAIYGGGLGNFLDRLRLGYVVDMIETLFMDFPVFNVADCFITCGCAALLAHMIFKNRGFWKDEKK